MSPVESPSHADDAGEGVPEVEVALIGVSALDGQPLSEHLAVLDGAHGELRRLLDMPRGVTTADARPADSHHAAT